MKTMRRRSDIINWKKLAAIDVSKFEEEMVAKAGLLEEIAPMLAFCSIETEFDILSLDQNFVKMFKLAQIILEHLLNEYSRLKEVEKEANKHQDLLSENKKLRKLIQVHQQAFSMAGIGSNDGNVQCPYCPKTFYGKTYLNSHISRRHPSHGLDSEGTQSLTQRISNYQSLFTFDNKSIEQILSELNAVRLKLDKTESDLTTEREARERLEDKVEAEVAEKVREMEENWRERQRLDNDADLMEKHLSREEREEDEKDEDTCDRSESRGDCQWNRRMERIMLTHTQEVQKLGSNIHLLVSKIVDPKYEHISTEKHRKVAPLPPRECRKVAPKEEPSVIIEEVEDDDLEEDQEDEEDEEKEEEDVDEEYTLQDIEEHVEAKLRILGVNENAEGVDDQKLKSALKSLRKERKLNDSSLAVRDQILTCLENELRFRSKKVIKKSKSTKTAVKQVIDQKSPPKRTTETIVVSKAKPKAIKLTDDKDAVTVKKDEQATHRKEKEKKNEKAVEVTENVKMPTKEEEEEEEGEAIKPAPRLKSVLSRVNKTREKKDTDKETRIGRKIRFNETRIEISPEQSEESEMEEIPLTPSSGGHRKKEEEDDDDEELPESSSFEKPPIPTPRQPGQSQAKAIGSGSVHWSDDDDDDYENLLQQTLGGNSKDHPLEQKASTTLSREDIRSNGSGSKNVQELAQMIEDQLNTRRQMKPPPGSFNLGSSSPSVSAIKSEGSTRGLPSATVNYDMDSD